jgi:hypothetical protein
LRGIDLPTLALALNLAPKNLSKPPSLNAENAISPEKPIQICKRCIFAAVHSVHSVHAVHSPANPLLVWSFGTPPKNPANVQQLHISNLRPLWPKPCEFLCHAPQSINIYCVQNASVPRVPGAEAPKTHSPYQLSTPPPPTLLAPCPALSQRDCIIQPSVGRRTRPTLGKPAIAHYSEGVESSWGSAGATPGAGRLTVLV